MSSELRDLRAKITVETDAVLDAVASGSGRDRSELVREVLHKWALEQIALIPAQAKLLEKRLQAEGLLREHSGNGNAGKDVGIDLQLERTGSWRNLKP